MTISKQKEDSKLTFILDGRLDTATAPKLQDELIPIFDSESEVVLDIANLAYVSSAGLRVLLMGHKTAKAKGGKLTLINVSEAIMEIFKMTGFADMLVIL